ncbi:NifB/NifX family molybdenum-iron cluster-binding protein [Geoalkalibacter subterraneus]|uniref:Dinitrogenase iron-molybdenum cofactor biosynthesis domain-containing protein n=1 Tax=Geoalkalibacter subterraneus TaxID=483547 RepID=A0A0B5FH39_9BACT|nr:NifB/NifX family molybdenum-iron cluster-binding protein [Geoalkalibacter subterraneus]AJF07477.1 hypothetical protein GSUB_14225 [Geoalkalibacter subterraneus]
METNQLTVKRIRVALPLYGNRVLPRFGLAREFALADLDCEGDVILGVERCEWPSWRWPSVPEWLKAQGAVGVLCSGIHPRLQQALQDEGLWVVWGFMGEVEEVLKLWLLQGAVEGRAPAASSPCCRRRTTPGRGHQHLGSGGKS